MCLTLANATAIIDHHTSQRPTGRAYTRTFHHAAQLSPGDLFRPNPNQDPHTVYQRCIYPGERPMITITHTPRTDGTILDGTNHLVKTLGLEVVRG